MCSKITVTDGNIVEMPTHRERYPLLAVAVTPEEMAELKSAAERWKYRNRNRPLPGGLMGAIIRECWEYFRSVDFNPVRVCLPAAVKRSGGTLHVRATGEIGARLAVMSRHAGRSSASEYLRAAVEAFLASEQVRLDISDAKLDAEVRYWLKKTKTQEIHR